MSEDEEFEFRHRLEQEQAKPKPLKIGVEGMGDAMSSVMKDKGWLQRNAAAFGSFPRQMYEGAKQMIGQGDEGNIQALRAMDREAPTGAIGGALASMIPLSRIPGANTIGGQTLQGLSMGALMPTMGDESRGTNALVSGALGGGLAGVMKGVSPMVSKLFSNSETVAATKASQNAVRDATIEAAQKEGYVIPPTVTGGGITAKAMESLGGKAAVGQEASIRNQQVTNKIARAEAGLKPDEAISESTLAAARDSLAAPYKEISALSPKASKALEDLKSARLDAKNHWQFFNRTGDPKVLKQAQAFDAKADRFEQVIENEAARLSAPGGLKSDYAKAAAEANGITVGRDLVERLQESRKALAKNFDVEKALNVGTGDVDAKAIGRMLDKRGEKGVTGGLQTIGKFAEAFPTFAREAPSGQSGPGVSKLTPYVAGALGLGGYQASEHYGMGPWGAAAAALPLMSGPARSMALSKMMQTGPSYGASRTLSLADLAARNKALPGAAAASGLTLQELSQ